MSEQNGNGPVPVPDGAKVELPRHTSPIDKQPTDMRVFVEAVHDLETGQGFLKMSFHTDSADFVGFIPGTHAPKFAHEIQIKANQASISKPPGGLVIP